MVPEEKDSAGGSSDELEVLILQFRSGDSEEELFSVPVDLIRTYKVSDGVDKLRERVAGVHPELLKEGVTWAAVATATAEWEPGPSIGQTALDSIARSAAHPGPGRSMFCVHIMHIPR